MAKNQEQEESLLDEAGSEALARLSDQVDKAIATIGELRKERTSLEGRITELQTRVDELESEAGRADELEKQQSALEDEKAQIRDRIEAILEKFESLDAEE